VHADTNTPRAKVVSLDAHKPIINATTPPPLSASAMPYAADDPQAALASKFFLEGSRLDDGDERNMEAAASAYRRALIIDTDLVPALVNLANIRYARDELIEAQALYERAIGLDPDCFEAHFNLGNIQHDLGRYDRALGCYRHAVALNGGYADAHFYLAVTLEKLGHSQEAKSPLEGLSGACAEGGVGRLSEGISRLVRKVETLALFRCAPQLVERAVRAPRVGDEPFLSLQTAARRRWVQKSPTSGVARQRQVLNFSTAGETTVASVGNAWASAGGGREIGRIVGMRQCRGRRKRICVVHHPCNSRPNDFWSA
jgi:hypothetical protein